MEQWEEQKGNGKQREYMKMRGSKAHGTILHDAGKPNLYKHCDGGVLGARNHGKRSEIVIIGVADVLTNYGSIWKGKMHGERRF